MHLRDIFQTNHKHMSEQIQELPSSVRDRSLETLLCTSSRSNNQ